MEKFITYIGLVVAAAFVILATAVTYVKNKYNLRADLSPREGSKGISKRNFWAWCIAAIIAAAFIIGVIMA